MGETRDAIIETTINLVAQNGLEGFSTRDLAKPLGISHTNIYSHFGSKDALLMECYLSINREIAKVFSSCVISEEMTKEEIIEYVHQHWKRYFRFMINNGNHSLYYYIYRDSSRLKDILMKNNQTAANDMGAFMVEFSKLANVAGLFDNIKPDYFWAYILDGTGIFVKHILRGNTDFVEDEDIETVWNLLIGGVRSFMRR